MGCVNGFHLLEGYRKITVNYLEAGDFLFRPALAFGLGCGWGGGVHSNSMNDYYDGRTNALTIVFTAITVNPV
jgi:hypothetical protein